MKKYFSQAFFVIAGLLGPGCAATRVQTATCAEQESVAAVGVSQADAGAVAPETTQDDAPAGPAAFRMDCVVPEKAVACADLPQFGARLEAARTMDADVAGTLTGAECSYLMEVVKGSDMRLVELRYTVRAAFDRRASLAEGGLREDVAVTGFCAQDPAAGKACVLSCTETVSRQVTEIPPLSARDLGCRDKKVCPAQ